MANVGPRLPNAPPVYDLRTRTDDGTSILVDPEHPDFALEFKRIMNAPTNYHACLSRVIEFVVKHSHFRRFTASAFVIEGNVNQVKPRESTRGPDQPQNSNTKILIKTDSTFTETTGDKTFKRECFGKFADKLQIYTDLTNVRLSDRLTTASFIASTETDKTIYNLINIVCTNTGVFSMRNSSLDESKTNFDPNALVSLLIFMCNDNFYNNLIEVYTRSKVFESASTGTSKRKKMHEFFNAVLPTIRVVPAEPFLLLGDRPPEFFDMPIVEVWAMYYAAHYFFVDE